MIERTQTDLPLQQSHHNPSVQARRRHALGIVLLMLGTVWLTLRLTGQISYLPICWWDGLAEMMQRFHLGCGGVSVSTIGYGMLWMLGV